MDFTGFSGFGSFGFLELDAGCFQGYGSGLLDLDFFDFSGSGSGRLDLDSFGFSGSGSSLWMLDFGFFLQDIGVDRDVKMLKSSAVPFQFRALAVFLRRLVISSGFSDFAGLSSGYRCRLI